MLIPVCSMMLCMPFGFWLGYMAYTLEGKLYDLMQPKTKVERRIISWSILLGLIVLLILYCMDVASMMMTFYE